MAPCPPLKTLWAAAAGCNSRDSETDGWHPVHPSKASGQPRQVASLGIPRLTDGALSTPQNPLGSRGRLHPLRPSKASGCNSRDSETDGWHPVHPSKPSGQPQQVAILGIPCPPLKTLWAAAAGCNSKDSETDGWDPVHPSKPSGQPQQVAILGIPRLTDGTLSTPQNPLGSRGSAILGMAPSPHLKSLWLQF